MDRRKKNMLVISITLVITAIIVLASFAVAKYVLKNAQNVDVVLKNAKIAETEIKLSTEDWTNGKVSVSISTNKKGEIYYKVNEKGEWTKYDKSFEVEENCDIYAKLKYTDGEGPETVKKVQNIDKIAPKVIVTKSNYKTFVWNATESTSGIAGYAITTTSTAPTSFTTGATATGTKEITAAGTYYVWVKDNAGNIGSASISAYTVTRSQGTGSTLTTRLDGTSASAGTSVTSNTVVLGGTTVWASATANTGYNTPVLKNGSTALTATGATVTVNGNVTISSSATINTYTVTYNYKTNGGTTATKETATVAYGSAIDLTPTATKAGWTFVGWNTSSTAKAKLSSLKMGTGNVTLYAIYSKTIKGTFKYSTDATKDISVSETIYNTATKATLKAPATTEIVVPSGYTFRHWSTSNAANASSTVGAGESITITADTENNPQTQNYYASYNKTVTVTFYYSAGASDNAQKSITSVGVQYLAYNGTKVESTISVPTAVTGSTGYRGTTYKGVSTTKSSTTAATSITTATTTYYAYYQSGITYYYYNGTAHTSSSATRTATTNGTEYSTAVNTTPTPSAYDGAAFKGWSSSASTVNAVTPNATTVTSLYAYYQKEITGTFNYYDGTKAASTKTSATRTYISKSGGVSTINANYAVPAAVSTSRTIGGVTYTYRGVSTANGANATIATPTTANATFYASYTYPIKVTFDGNGATGTAPTALSGTGYMNYAGTKVGASLKMPANTFVKTGYKFENWSETKETTSGKYVVGTSYTFTANATLYPAWTIYNYKNTTKSTYFMTLPEALNKAVTGDTIQVIRGRAENTAATVASGKTVTLDLNGQTVIMSNVELTNNGTLTITGASGALTSATGRVVTNNGTFTKSGNCKIEGSSTIGSTIVNNGTATITAGAVSSTNYNAIYNGETSTTAKLTVSGGTIKSKEKGIVNKAKGTVTVTNGTITSTGQAVYNEAEGTINISGGAITSTGNNTIVNGSEATGTITISGGTIDNTATDNAGRPCVINYKGNIVIKDNANVNSMYARTVLQYVGDGTIDIQGGTITNSSTTQNTLCYAVGAESGTVKISGGTISSKIANAVKITGATINISGGSITSSGADAIMQLGSANTTITGGTITSNATGFSGLAVGGGTAKITGGKLTGKAFGIWCHDTKKTTVTLGENDSKVSITTPEISGTEWGVYTGTATFNFYDGILKGAKGQSIKGENVTATATNCVIVKTTSGSTETAVLGPSAPAVTAKLNNSSGANYTAGTWTGQNIWVQLKSASIGAGIKEYQWYKNGAWTSSEITTASNTGTILFTATRNETIRFRAIDNNGVVSAETVFGVKIDKTGPTISSVTPATTWDYSNDVTVNATDNESISAYAVTTTNTAPTEWIETTNIDLSNVQTKRENGASWARVFYHNNRGGSTLFANETEAKSVDVSYKYSALGTLDNYKDTTGNWEFMLQYPEIKGKYNRWKQTGNPATTTIANGDGSANAPGYSAVHIDWNYDYWGGLTKSTAPETFLNGSVGTGTWFYAIGVYKGWYGGIPGPNDTAVFQGTELWARIDTLTKASKKTLTAKVGNLTTNGTYYVWVKDHLGNVSSKAVTTNKVDTTAPTAPTITNSSGGNWTNQDVKITLSSTDSQSGVLKYQCKYSGTSNQWADAKSTDTWSAARNETIYYRAIDNAGNVSAVSSTAIKIDKTAPAAPTITNSSGGNWTNQSVTTKVTSTDAMSGIAKYQIKYSGTSNAWRDFDNNNSSHTSWAGDRNETLYFRTIDNAGNISAESSTSVKIDKTVPTATINRTSANTFDWKASDTLSGVAGYAVTTSGSTPTSWTTNGTLTSGTKTISAAGTYYVWIKDKAGNVNKATINAYTVTYDYNGTKNYIVPLSNTIKCTGFSGALNTCFSLGTINKDDLKVGDQLTVSFTASYSGLTVVSGQTASLVGQGSGNVTEWNTGFPGKENGGDNKVHWTGTASNVTYTYRTRPLTSTDLTNDSWAFGVRTDYYSAGTITISNIKVTRTTKESNVFLNGAALGTLPAPTERGYTLDGWYTAVTGGTKIATTTTATANATYYAHWAQKGYTITLATNGGTYNGATANSIFAATYGNDVNIGYPVKAGYTFNGWKDSTGKIYDRNLLKNAEAPKEFVDGSKSTNALGGWRTASVSGGTRSVVGYQDPPLPGIRKGFRITASGTATSLDVCQDQVPVTVGKYYTISVWAKGSGGLWLQAGNSSYTGKLFSMSNVTSWTKYSWTFKAGTDGSANNNMTNIYFGNHGATGTIDICGMKLEEGTGFKSTLWANTAANTTLTAQWTANNYTIKIDPNGGKFNNSTSVATYTKTFGSTVAATAPTKTGYTFGGWVPVKTEAGATWAEVLYHNNQGGTTLFANETEVKSVNTAQKYSILGQLETFRANTSSQFEFLLKYDEFGTQYNRWKQTSNPTSGTTISGYSAVSNSWTGDSWGGIAKSSSTSYTFLDGSPNADTWWYAIGSYQAYKKGIPGPNDTVNMESMSLYVKVNDDLSNITKAVTGVVNSSNNYIVRNDITLKAVWIPNTYTITYDNNYLTNDLYKNSVLVGSYGYATTAPKTKTTAEDLSAKYGRIVQLTMNAGTGGGPYLGGSRLTVGTTYTWSVYVKASREITLGLVGQEQGGRKSVKVTTNWQRITCTFKATDYTYNAFTFYNPSGGWKDGDILYVHSLELSQVGTLNTSTATKKYGNTLSSLPAPTRTGYTFAGWYTAPTGGTKIATTTAVPASNTTYYAHWTVNNYYLDLNGNCDGNGASSINGYGTANVVINGVTDATGVTDYYKQWPYGTQYTINNITATTGHTYNGVESGSASGTITATTPVSLKFTTNKYNLTFQNVYNAFEVKILSSAGALKKTVNVSSSSPTISDISYTDIVQTGTTGVKQTLSGTAFTEVKCSNVPTRTGYTWNSSVRYTMGAENAKAYRWDGTKWYTDNNGDTTCSTFSRLASTNGYTAKLTIGWKLNTYTISYNLAGGSVATANPTSYNVTSNTITLNNPTRTGYTFLGWTGSSDLSSGLGSYTTSNPYNAAVRDHALGNAFNVTAGSTYRVMVTAKRTKGTLNLAGGIWYTTQSSGNSYDGLGAFTLAETLSDGWARYYRDVKVPDGKTKGKVYIQLEQKSGSYTTAWSVADMSVIPQSTTTTIPKGSVGNRSYRANWKINSYTVTYDYKTNGGTTASKISSVAYGSAIDLTPTATKAGWTFVGWNTSSTAKAKLSSLKMGTSNVTLYAIYSKTLTGTFKYYNNQSKTVPITIYNTATSGKITAPGALGTPDGWKFRHWSTSSAANASSSVAASGSVTISANTTYYASYQQTVTATFYYHKGTDQFNTTQTSETASGTKYMGYAGATVNGSISIPSEVTGSTAIYGCNYAGVSTSTDSLTAATAVTTEKTKYYAYYDVGVTYYYYNGSKIVSTNPSNSRRRATSNGSAYVVTATNVPSTTAKYDSAAFVSWTYDQSKIDSRTPTKTAVTTLYAYYQKSVTATFRYSTGSDTATTTAPGTKSYITNTSAMRTVHGNITIPNAAKADRNMFGTPAKFNGVSTATAANATNVTPTTANTTYYTNYKYTVKVTYNSNGATKGSAPAASSGTGYINYQGNIYGYHLTMPSNTTNMAKVVQVGSGQTLQNITCQFNGWNEKTDGTGRAYTVGTKYEFIKDTTIYARWFRPIYKNTTTNKTYDIFQYAVNEATSGQKIQMQQTNTVEPVQINIPSDKTIYLDLNNKTMNITKTILNYGNLYVNSGTSGGGIESTGGVAAIHSDGDTLYLGICSIKSDGYGVELNAMGRFEGTGIIATKNSVVYNAAGITTTVVNCHLQSTSITGVYTKNGIFMANKTTIQGDYGLFNENAIVELYGGTKVTGTTHAGAINWSGYSGTIKVGLDGNTYSTSEVTVTGKTYGVSRNSGTVIFNNGTIKGESGAISGTYSVRSGYSAVSTTSGSYKVLTLKAASSDPAGNMPSLSSLAPMSRAKAVNIGVNKNITNDEMEKSDKNESNSVENTEENKNTTEENTSQNETNNITTDEEKLNKYTEDQIKNAKKNEEKYKTDDLYVRYEGKKYSDNPEDIQKKNKELDLNVATLWKDTTNTKEDAIVYNGKWLENYLELDGKTTYAVLNNIQSDTITLEATIELPKETEDRTEQVKNKEENNETEQEEQLIIGNEKVEIYITKDKKIVGKLHIKDKEYTVTSTIKIEPEKVYGIALTYDGENIRLYVNDKEEQTAEVKGSIKETKEDSLMSVGAKYTEDEEGKEVITNYFEGKIYSVAIYKKALSKDDVVNNYNYNINYFKSKEQ